MALLKLKIASCEHVVGDEEGKKRDIPQRFKDCDVSEGNVKKSCSTEIACAGHAPPRPLQDTHGQNAEEHSDGH